MRSFDMILERFATSEVGCMFLTTVNTRWLSVRLSVSFLGQWTFFWTMRRGAFDTSVRPMTIFSRMAKMLTVVALRRATLFSAFEAHFLMEQLVAFQKADDVTVWL